MKDSFQNNVIPDLRNLTLLLAVLLISIGGCDNITSTTSPDEDTGKVAEVETSSPDNIHVAFAGGGWRAHTAHTAWTMSLLETNGNKLDNVFQHVQSIGSNSGGSWFSTMLMYSSSFVIDIETIPLKNWGSTSNGGWLGEQQKLFDKATFLGSSITPYCKTVSGDAFVACVFDYYADPTNWNAIVDKIVFKKYSLGSSILKQAHQPWAKDKSLLLAASMLTSNVVLNEEGITTGYAKRYYQACLSPGKPIINGYEDATCNNGIITEATPVAFSSVPSHLQLKKPSFLLAAGTGPEQAAFTISYANNFKSGAKIRTTSVQNPLNYDNIPVINAASASSAAVGFAASDNVSGYWEASYKARDLAPAFSLSDSIVSLKDPYDMSMDHLRDNIMVRIADGGAVDNSGVAQLMSFLQLNGKGIDFNIVAFDNVQEQPFLTGEDGAAVGNDIAMLFGYALCEGNNFCSGSNCSGFCINVPNLQIFESKTIQTPITWSYQTKKDKTSKYKDLPKLIYTKYKVKTTQNDAFGIKAGSTGYLHAFTCIYPDASTVPENYGKGKSFKGYQDMMQFINDGLKSNNNEGLIFLEKAMGLK